VRVSVRVRFRVRVRVTVCCVLPVHWKVTEAPRREEGSNGIASRVRVGVNTRTRVDVRGMLSFDVYRYPFETRVHVHQWIVHVEYLRSLAYEAGIDEPSSRHEAMSTRYVPCLACIGTHTVGVRCAVVGWETRATPCHTAPVMDAFRHLRKSGTPKARVESPAERQGATLGVRICVWLWVWPFCVDRNSESAGITWCVTTSALWKPPKNASIYV